MAQLSDTKSDEWSTMATLYKKLTIDVSHRPITTLLTLTNSLLPFSSSTGIHDNGCGPGPVLSRLLSTYGSSIPVSAKLSCSDFSPAMIEQVRATQREALEADPESIWGRVETGVMDAMDLSGIGDGERSHVTAGWVYFMTAEPRRCLSESLRVLCGDGVLGCSSWKGSDWMELMKLPSTVKAEAKMPSFPEVWMSTRGMEGELEAAGFRDVQAVEVPVTMTFESYDELVELLTEKMPHMVNMLKGFSGEEMAEVKRVMREEIERKAPEQPYALQGVALVAVGRK